MERIFRKTKNESVFLFLVDIAEKTDGVLRCWQIKKTNTHTGG